MQVTMLWALVDNLYKSFRSITLQSCIGCLEASVLYIVLDGKFFYTSMQMT